MEWFLRWRRPMTKHEGSDGVREMHDRTLPLAVLEEIAAAVRLRLNIPHRIEPLEPDQLFYGFLLWDAGKLRTKVFVPWAPDTTRMTLTRDVTHQVMLALELCPLCGAQSLMHRFDRILEVRCGGCGRYAIDEELVKDLSAARATADVSAMGDARRVALKVKELERPPTLNRATFARLLAEGAA